MGGQEPTTVHPFVRIYQRDGERGICVTRWPGNGGRIGQASEVLCTPGRDGVTLRSGLNEATAMCGRFRLETDWLEIARTFDLAETERGRNTPARYNIAPSQDVLIIGQKDGERVVREARWGLVPNWAKPDASRMPKPINARAETVETGPMFRSAFRAGRCLVPADGWYEWTKELDGKQPHLIQREDGTPFAFAGIAARNEAQGLLSIAIITVPAAEGIAAIHPRMPAALRPDLRAAWLDPATPASDARSLLEEVETAFVHHPVSRAINSACHSERPEALNSA